MAIEYIEIKDAAEVSRKVAVDQFDTDFFAQLMKLGFSADGVIPVQVSASNPLPVLEAAIATLLGEVQASPSTNTVLARLKNLLTGIILAAGDNNIGNVDIVSLPITKTLADLIGTQASKTTIGAGASSTSSALDCSSVKRLLAGMQVVFGATPDGNARLEVFTSPDGTNWDTKAYAQFEIDYAASEPEMESAPINADAQHARIKISNLDTTDSIDVWGFVTTTQ